MCKYITRALLLGLALTSLSQAATPAFKPKPYYPTMTGDRLVRYHFGPPQPRDNPFLKGGDVVDHERARGFMDGIKDATQGTVWCFVAGKPHELNDDIAGAISKLGPEEQKGAAAPLVISALRQLYPCAAKREAP
ncbi:Rap1a/Tai family immunity protein [Massilia glaciei]|uniref:Rap1a immunity protein domain-containing protein n=1 Tax=Massilia glaciei TaxID=1524097 RepID=A0A2U2HHE0_9BURK|nr:Rap1a/Tai family immunity protein [Massilia glaciei]PWF45090.1 hypothetical protein C7C56_018040 [Massilia glaciei]